MNVSNYTKDGREENRIILLLSATDTTHEGVQLLSESGIRLVVIYIANSRASTKKSKREYN